MNVQIHSRKAVYAFLYEQYVKNPNTYFSREDLEQFAEKEQIGGVLRFGLQMGHLLQYRQKYYQLTALGVLFAEQNNYVTE